MPPFLTTTVAIAIMLTGMVASLMPLPLPLGTPIVAFGLMLLIASSPRAARWMLAGRTRLALFDRGVRLLEAHGGRRVRAVLRRTRPQRLPRRA